MSRERYICMNHPEESWIFDSSKDDPVCPKCKKTGWVFFYSGDIKPQRVESKKSDDKPVKKPKKEVTKVTKVTTEKKRGRGRPPKDKSVNNKAPKRRGRPPKANDEKKVKK